eukprot:COSAG01_NODE_16788_length_1204_cov_3.153846_1_plen_68_part_10
MRSARSVGVTELVVASEYVGRSQSLDSAPMNAPTNENVPVLPGQSCHVRRVETRVQSVPNICPSRIDK